MLIAIFILVMLAVYLTGCGILELFSHRTDFLKDLYSSSQKEKYSLAVPLSVVKRISSAINRPFSRFVYLNNLQNQLDFLKLPFGAIELLLAKEVLLIITGFIVSIFSLKYAILAALAAFVIPDLLIGNKVKGKKDAIIRHFPETVDILNLCIGAGLDFVSSIRWIIEKSHTNPFIEQLAVVMSEIKVGKSRSEALDALAARLKIPDVNSFVRTIIQAERMGTSIEEALKNISEDVRLERFQRGERQAIKASLKILFPLLFLILPVIMIIVAGPILINFTQGGLTGAGGGNAGVMNF
jgi:tight adherence protein C